MKLYILELDLRLEGKDRFNDIPNEWEFVVKGEENTKDVPTILTHMKNMVKDTLMAETPELGEAMAEKVNKSLDEFLLSFDIKRNHSENHSGLGSFTWTSRSTSSKKRISWPKDLNQ